MRDLILTIFIFGLVPVAVLRPHFGILIFAWIGYMNPHRFTWGFAYTMPFAAVIGAATILGFLFTRDKRRLPLNGLIIVWVAWIVWMNVTTLFALVPEVAYEEWDRAMKIQLTSIMAISLLQTRERLMYLVWIVALSVGFFGVKGGIFTAATGGNHIVFGPPGTFFEGNNGLAVALLMVLPLFWYLQSHSDNKWIRRAMLISFVLIAISVLGSYSRGAFLGLVAIGLYLIYKSRSRWVLLPIVLAISAVVVLFLPEKYTERIKTIQTYEQDGSAMGRINTWIFAYNLANERPAVGGGYGAFTPELFRSFAPDPDDFHDAHSIYFEVLGEHGFIGLGLFLTLGWLGLRLGERTRNRCRGSPELVWAFDLASMIQVCLVGYAVAGSFVGLAYFDLYYHILAIQVLTSILADQQIANAKKASASVDGDSDVIKLNQDVECLTRS